jgi:hypothetical protein
MRERTLCDGCKAPINETEQGAVEFVMHYGKPRWFRVIHKEGYSPRRPWCSVWAHKEINPALQWHYNELEIFAGTQALPYLIELGKMCDFSDEWVVFAEECMAMAL